MKPHEIKEIRNKLGVTQEVFAHMLGASMVTINRWEKGHTKPSNIYVKQIKNLKGANESYVSRTKKD